MTEYEIFTLSNTLKKITHILHASDIHIRTGDLEKCRYTEYKTVIDTFIKNLSTLEYLNSSVLVLTGDIFHHKGKIEPSGIKLALHFLDSLLEHIDVLFICGNHDYRQDDPTIPDMIETIFKNYFDNLTTSKHKAYYLNQTGCYQYENIGFTVVDVRDTLKHYNTSGRVDTLLDFPSKDCYSTIPEIEHTIALFHGTILPSKLMNNLQLQDGYQIEWFGNYPYILLGDNHRMQFTQELTGSIWGYPGSFIQQDFGENLFEHGYLIWDLIHKKVHFHKVNNDYGFCTIKKHHRDLYVHYKNKQWIKISEIDSFPKYPSIRIFDKEIMEDVQSYCKENQITPKCIQYWSAQNSLEKEESVDNDYIQELEKMDELNTTEKWLDYLSNFIDTGKIQQFILHPENLKLPIIDPKFDFIKKFVERNDKIHKAIDEYNTEVNKVHLSTQRVELMNMSWAYLMCYGNNNHFHFDSLKDKIGLLNGKNAMGKSSFLDVLCIGLYGEPTKMRNIVNGKKYTDKIIHDQRPTNKIAPFVRIMFRVGNQIYEIYRSFGTQAAKNKEHLILQTAVQIFKVTSAFDDVYKELLYEGSTLVDKWVEENIGTMESVLMSTMICQIDLNNFFHMKQDEQKNILDKALKLDTVSLYGKILKESVLAHQDMLQQIKTAYQTVQHVQTMDDKLQKNLQEIYQKLESIENFIRNIASLKDMWKPYVQEYVSIDEIPQDITELYESQEFLQKTLDKKITQEDVEDYIRYKERLENLSTKLEDLTDIKLYKDAKKQLDKWNKKYQKFLKLQPKCDVSIEWIEQTLQEYQEWCNKYIQYDISSYKDLLAAYDNTEKDLMSFTLVEEPKKPFIEDYQIQDCNITDESYLDALEQYQELTKLQLFRNRTESEYQQWKDKYDAWCDEYAECEGIDIDQILQDKETYEEKIASYHEKNAELEDIKKELLSLEEDMEQYKTLEFNQECWACNKNPFQAKKKDIENSYKEMTKYHKQLLKYIDKLSSGNILTKWKDKLYECNIILQKYNRYTAEKTTLDEEKVYWNHILEEWNTYDSWVSKVKQMKETIDTYEIHSSQIQWEKYHTQYATKELIYNKYMELKTQKEAYIGYLNEKEHWDKVMLKLDTYKKIYEDYLIWQKEQQEIVLLIQAYEKSLEKERLLVEHNKLHQDVSSLHEAVENYHLYKKYKSMYYQKKIYDIETEYHSFLEQKHILLEEKSKLETLEEKYKEQQKFLHELSTIEKQYQERLQQIKELEIMFIGDKTQSDGYKEWIYKNQVTPLLNKEINKFLHMFESFSFEMTYDKKNFIYMIEDRGNKPTLDKASGYQNFIIGLALRITLSRIGAIGQQLKHLFIDEGFTACDSTNIEKVPLLLDSLLKYGDYHSILVMSHLESVRESTNTFIEISRKDPFSYIQYGIVYPDIHVFDSKTGSIMVKKQRGRPPKSKAV